MLGAQARAAELAAASAAKQRQASRELEERQLPPNSAVSLSAFTKPQPTTSRNKGNKNWKPLILDDIAEGSDDNSTSNPPLSTPTKSDPMSAKDVSDKKIPTAPRAMVAGRALSTVVAHPQPSKTQASPVVNMPTRNTPQGYGPMHHGGFPYPIFTSNFYLPQPMDLTGMPHNDTAPFQTLGSMMAPDDLSPTKQEQKFSMLENIPLPHMMHGHGFSHFPAPQHSMVQNNDLTTQGTTPAFEHDQQYMWDDSGNGSYFPDYSMPFHGLSQHISSGYEDETGGGYPDMHMPRTTVSRSTTTPAGQDFRNQQTILPVRRGSGQQPPQESPLRYQEPYDTKRAMDECMNRLRESAKEGKTVLHNPDVHKEGQQMQTLESDKVKPTMAKHSNHQLPVPWEVQPRDNNVKANEWEVLPPPAVQYTNESTPFVNNLRGENDPSMIKPAPGLPFPSTLGPPNLSVDDSMTQAPDSLPAPKVGSAEWMRLAPILAAERDRVRKCMARAAKAVTNEVPQDSMTTSQGKEDLAETQKWFHIDARGERLLRKQVELSAQVHASKAMANIRARNGGELPDGFTDGRAATLILGNVACNLQTYLVGDRNSLEQRKNFHKVKSVPDWCTERGGGLALGGVLSGGGDSYFDGAAGGFYGAPVRVARDPRFRPQLKEGMKMKPEEEWKNRHEMYGRRII